MSKDRESLRFKLTNEFEWFFAILAFSCVTSYFSVGAAGWDIEHAGGHFNIDFKTLAMLICGLIYSVVGLIRLFGMHFQNKIAALFYISAMILSVVVLMSFTLSFRTFAEAHKSYTVYPPLSGKPAVVSALYPPYRTSLILLFAVQAIMVLEIAFTGFQLLRKRKIKST